MIVFIKLLAAAGIAILMGRRLLRARSYLRRRRQPAFFFAGPKTGKTPVGIPVFTYHSVGSLKTPDSVTPEAFEAHMRHLSDNGYHTLDADGLYDHLVSGAAIPDRSVVLTFDDGRATLWTVAFPILKRHGFKAVSFVSPGAIRGSGMRPTREAEGAGSAAAPDADLTDVPTVTWDEMKFMHASGLVDFQSHTLDHTLIFCAPEIQDFVHPSYRFGYDNWAVPVLRDSGLDRLHCRPEPGTPVYRYQPRMGAARRYFDDENLRRACVDHVKQQGAEKFFRRPQWRAELHRLVTEYRKTEPRAETFETPDEQRLAIHGSLLASRQMLEAHLPGHRVRHLAYPWHRYSILAASLARELGYVSAFIDINPQKPSPAWNDPYVVQSRLPANEYGDDPYQITRIDARDDLILSLPGRGRLTYGRRILSRCVAPPGFLKR